MQNSLFVQIISGAITIILWFLTCFFWDKHDKVEEDIKQDEVKEDIKLKKIKVITIMMATTTVIGTLYFFYNLIIACNDSADMFSSILKGSIFIIILIEIFLWFGKSLSDFEVQAVFIVIGVVVVAAIILLGDLVYDCTIEAKYEKNIVQVEEPKIVEEKYKLYPIYKVNDSASSYFRIITNGEEKLYEFYYIIDEETQEMRNETLNVEYNGIVPLKDGEIEPYLYIKSKVSYSINNNENPPTVIDQKVISTKYELHISEEDMKKVVQSTK